MSRGGGARSTKTARESYAARTAPRMGGSGGVRRTRGDEAFRSAYLAAGVAMARLTPEGQIIDANPSFGRMLGVAASKLSGRPLLDLIHSDDASSLRAGRLSTLKAGTIRAELRFVTGGSVVWGRATISLARRSDDYPESLILTVEDLSALKSKEAALEQQRLHDPATGLPNVTLLSDRLGRSISAARRAGRKLAVLVLEIDRFAAIEEVRGPAAARELVGYLGARLQEKLRSTDSVARTSSNELAIVLSKVDEAELAAGVGRRLLATLEPEFYLGEAGFQIKISMGVALFPEQGRTAEALLRPGAPRHVSRQPCGGHPAIGDARSVRGDLRGDASGQRRYVVSTEHSQCADRDDRRRAGRRSGSDGCDFSCAVRRAGG